MTMDAIMFDVLVVLLVGGFQAALPVYSRRTIFFSVTVSEDFRETNDGRSIMRQFRYFMLLWTLVAVALVLVTNLVGNPWPLGAAMLVLGAGTAATYLRGRNQARRHAVGSSAERVAALTARSDDLSAAYFSMTGALLLFIGTGLIAWLRWDQVFDTVSLLTTHAAYGWMEAVMLMVVLAIVHGSRRGSPLRSVNLAVVITFMWVNSTAVAVLTFLRWNSSSVHAAAQVFPFGWLLVISGTILWGLRKASKLRDSRDPTPDSCWKLGQFYYNPEDTAYLVERRFGLGYSPNFAKPFSWIAIAILFLLPLIALVGIVMLDG